MTVKCKVTKRPIPGCVCLKGDTTHTDEKELGFKQCPAKASVS